MVIVPVMAMAQDPFLEKHIDKVEAQIRTVHAENEKLNAEIKSEEGKIEGLNKEIKEYEEQLKAIEAKLKEGNIEENLEIERQKHLVEQRLQNLINYESTLILRTSSRAEVLRALDKDLIQLYVQRKELRQTGGHKDMVPQDHGVLERVEQLRASSFETRSRSRSSAGKFIEGMTNVSISSGISSGDDDIRDFTHNPNRGEIEKVQQGENEDFEEGVEEEHPLRKLKVRRMDVQEGASLTPQYDSGRGSLKSKNNNVDDVAMSKLESESNKDNILDHDCARESCETLLLDSQGKKKKATRRTNRVPYRHLARRLTVDFDEKGNPVGPNAGGFKRSINSYVCHFMPINFKQIGDVPVEDYKALLNVLTERFNFDLNRKYTRKKISSCYRQHKYKLLLQIKKDIERGVEPEKPTYVKQEDWDAFVAKTKDEEFAKISKKNKANRSQQSGVHQTGRLSRSGHKRKLKEDSGREPLMEDAWTKAIMSKQGLMAPTCLQNSSQGLHKND
eukprot:Gb_28177 [translate_table: standard]